MGHHEPQRRVRSQAGDVWVETGRYWQRRTREIVYYIIVRSLPYTTRVAEHRLFPVREGQ